MKPTRPAAGGRSCYLSSGPGGDGREDARAPAPRAHNQAHRSHNQWERGRLRRSHPGRLRAIWV